jgi:hypothetical protein
MSANEPIEKVMRTPYSLSHGEIVSLLAIENSDKLLSAAYRLKCRYVGKTVSMRGIVEMPELPELARTRAIGETIDWEHRGDSLHCSKAGDPRCPAIRDFLKAAAAVRQAFKFAFVF